MSKAAPNSSTAKSSKPADKSKSSGTSASKSGVR
jgi:hypothetical protein